jgi:hypothetical protein
MHGQSERPKKIKKYIFELLYIRFICDFFIFVFVLSASPGSAGCFKNATQTLLIGEFWHQNTNFNF